LLPATNLVRWLLVCRVKIMFTLLPTNCFVFTKTNATDKLFCFPTPHKGIKVGLGISRTNADSQWNSAYNAFHRNRFCGNLPIEDLFSRELRSPIFVAVSNSTRHCLSSPNFPLAFHAFSKGLLHLEVIIKHTITQTCQQHGICHRVVKIVHEYPCLAR